MCGLKQTLRILLKYYFKFSEIKRIRSTLVHGIFNYIQADLFSQWLLGNKNEDFELGNSRVRLAWNFYFLLSNWWKLLRDKKKVNDIVVLRWD